MSVIPNDPFGRPKQPRSTRDLSLSPQEVTLLHLRSDVDAARYAQHHTLGHKHNQSAPGDHIHDGSSSKKVGDGANLTISGKLSPGTVAEVDQVLDSLISALKNVVEIDDNRT